MKVRPAQLIAIGLIIMIAGFGFARALRNRQLEAQVERMNAATVQMDKLLSGVDPALRQNRPPPKPDLSSWLVQNALTQLESKLVENRPLNKGQGVSLRLRRLTPQEVSALLARLSQVGVRLNTFDLSDADNDGQWNLELIVEVVGAPS